MPSISAGVCVLISPGILHPSPVATRQRDGTKGKGFSTSLLQWTICLGLPPLVAWYGVRKRSLDHSGGMAAIVVVSVPDLIRAAIASSIPPRKTFFGAGYWKRSQP